MSIILRSECLFAMKIELVSSNFHLPVSRYKYVLLQNHSFNVTLFFNKCFALDIYPIPVHKMILVFLSALILAK